MCSYIHIAWRTELQKPLLLLRWKLQPLQKRRSPQRRHILSCFKTPKRNKHTGFKNGSLFLKGAKRMEKENPLNVVRTERWKGCCTDWNTQLVCRLIKISITKKWMNNWNKASECRGICNSKEQVYQQFDQEWMIDSFPWWVSAAIRKMNKGTFYQSFSQCAIPVQCMSRWWRSYNL